VTHSIGGLQILRNFVVGTCNAPTDWNMADIAEEFIRQVNTWGGEGQESFFPFHLLLIVAPPGRSVCIVLVDAGGSHSRAGARLCGRPCGLVNPEKHRVAMAGSLTSRQSVPAVT
jgi:hypothetical protein